VARAAWGGDAKQRVSVAAMLRFNMIFTSLNAWTVVIAWQARRQRA
jgi:hypothetical protein